MTSTEVIKLLAIDDRADYLTALRAVVQDALPQTVILTAADGPVGVALAAAEDPDVILLGITRPGMDSFQVCRWLKADASLNEIPVVFVIDRDTDAVNRVKALEAGAEGFLTQPLDPAELTAQMRVMVKVKAANRSQRLAQERVAAPVARRTRVVDDSNEPFRVAQEMSPDGFTILHPLRSENDEIVDFTWVYENKMIARINGTDPQAIKGKRLLDLFPTHEGTSVWEAYTRVANTREPQIIEEIYVGEIVSKPTWLRLIVESLGEDIAILAHDITDRKQAEEELRQNHNMLDNILNTIPQSVFWKDRDSRYLGCNAQFAKAAGLQNPHDIVGKTDFDLPWPQEEAKAYRDDDRAVMADNSPKTHIIEPLQQADGSRLWIDTTKIPLLDSAGRVYGILGVYEDFSRRAVLERRPLDLLLFLKEIVTLLERTLPESIGIELVYAEDEYTVGADPTRMQQAIMNLATNARDAMLPQGGGALRIALSRTAATDAIRCVTCGQVIGGGWVRIAVTDSGSGIPPEALSHIFEPFFTTKEVGRGTGLGLAQVYGIVKQHEGHIDVVTEAGRGTTFNIYLPALPVQLPEAPALERATHVQGDGETVLVVEDNAVLRDALTGILELLNYRTLQAASGREALALLAEHADEIALVLSDLVMPEMGGQALFHALRQRGLTLPVVILSGHPLEDELQALQAQGLAGWMLKPPDVRKLGQLLARVLHTESEPG